MVSLLYPNTIPTPFQCNLLNEVRNAVQLILDVSEARNLLLRLLQIQPPRIIRVELLDRRPLHIAFLEVLVVVQVEDQGTVL